MKIKAEKDFWAGLLYMGIAAGFLWIGQDYKMGSASRMGPGYFPLTLSWVLFGFGVVSFVRSFFHEGGPVGGIGWKPLVLVTLAVISFGLLLPPAGLVLALPMLVIISSLSSTQSVYNFESLLIMVALTIFCALVFVKGLGVPMPIFGTWFDGIVPSSWQR